ncbi:MAG: methyltransferase domain-containing protein [Candidatus Acidiferrales bacterium]
MPRILDVGCGPKKYPGSIGIDMNPNTAADVLCHLDRGSLPFRDSVFDEVRAIHLIEHVDNVIRTIEEFHRITRPGGIIFLVTPHYTDFSSFCDPTHRWHLNSFSFWYFYPEGLHGEASWYSRARVKQRHLRVRLLQVWRYLGFEFLVNHSLRFRRFWEFYLCYVVRGKVMEFELEVLK